MASWQAHLTSFMLRHSVKPRLTAANSVAEIRDLMSASTGFTLPADIKVTKAVLGGVPGEWVELRSEKPDRLLLYVHGGGFVACSARTHRALTSGFAEQGFRVLRAKLPARARASLSCRVDGCPCRLPGAARASSPGLQVGVGRQLRGRRSGPRGADLSARCQRAAAGRGSAFLADRGSRREGRIAAEE